MDDFDPDEFISSRKSGVSDAPVDSGLDFDPDAFLSERGVEKGKPKIGVFASTRLKAQKSTGNTYEDNALDTTRAVAESVLPFTGKLRNIESNEQMTALDKLSKYAVPEPSGKGRSFKVDPTKTFSATRADNKSQAEVELDSIAAHAGFDEEDFKYAQEQSGGDVRKKAEIFRSLADSALKQRIENKTSANNELASSEQGTLAKVGSGIIDNAGYTAEFAMGGAIGGAAKLAVPAIASAANRMSDLSSKDYSLDENGGVVAKDNADSQGAAMGKASIGASIETGVEIGTDAALKWAFGPLGKALSKPVNQATRGVVKSLSKSVTGRVVLGTAKAYQKAAEITAVNGLGSEMIENYLQDTADELGGLGKKASEYKGIGQEAEDYGKKFFSTKYHSDMFLSMLGTMALQGGAASAKQYVVESGVNADKEGFLKSRGLEDADLKKLSATDKDYLHRIFSNPEMTPERAQRALRTFGDKVGAAAKKITDQEGYDFYAKQEGIEPNFKLPPVAPKDNEIATDEVSGLGVVKYSDGRAAIFDRDGKEAGQFGTLKEAVDAAKQLSVRNQAMDVRREQKVTYIGGIAKRLAGKSNIKIHNTVEDMLADTPDIANDQNYSPESTGVNHKGVTHIVLDNVGNPNDAVSVILHDVGAHQGLRNVLSKPGELQKFLGNLSSEEVDKYKEWVSKNGYTGTDVVPEEALAYMFGSRSVNPTGYQKAVSWLHTQLRKVNPNYNFTDSDIAVMMADAQKSVQGDGGSFEQGTPRDTTADREQAAYDVQRSAQESAYAPIEKPVESQVKTEAPVEQTAPTVDLAKVDEANRNTDGQMWAEAMRAARSDVALADRLFSKWRVEDAAQQPSQEAPRSLPAELVTSDPVVAGNAEGATPAPVSSDAKPKDEPGASESSPVSDESVKDMQRRFLAIGNNLERAKSAITPRQRKAFDKEWKAFYVSETKKSEEARQAEAKRKLDEAPMLPGVDTEVVKESLTPVANKTVEQKFSELQAKQKEIRDAKSKPVLNPKTGKPMSAVDMLNADQKAFEDKASSLKRGTKVATTRNADGVSYFGEVLQSNPDGTVKIRAFKEKTKGTIAAKTYGVDKAGNRVTKDVDVPAELVKSVDASADPSKMSPEERRKLKMAEAVDAANADNELRKGSVEAPKDLVDSFNSAKERKEQRKTDNGMRFMRKMSGIVGAKSTYAQDTISTDNGDMKVGALLRKIANAPDTKKDGLFLSTYGNDRAKLVDEMVLTLPNGTYLLSRTGRASPAITEAIEQKYGTMAGTSVSEKTIMGLSARHPESVQASLTLGLDEVRLSNYKTTDNGSRFMKPMTGAPAGVNTPRIKPKTTPSGTQSRYVRAYPSVEDESRRREMAVELAYENGLTPRTIAEMEEKGRAKYDSDAQMTEMDLLTGRLNSDKPEDMAAARVATDELNLKANNSTDPNVEATAILGTWRWYEKGTQVARSLRMRFDKLDTPESRLAWLSRALRTPTAEERAMLSKTQGVEAQVKALKPAAERARKILKALRDIKVRFDKEGKEIDLDFTHFTNEQLMDNTLMNQVLTAIATQGSSRGDKWLEYWRNSILSGPTTQFVNIGGNLAHAVLEATVQRNVEAFLNLWVKSPLAPTFHSNSVMYSNVVPNLGQAKKNMRDAWVSERPVTGPGASKLDEANAAIPGRAGKIIRMPQRAMTSVDEAFKTIFMGMLTADHATREFDALLKSGKVKESDRKAFMVASLDPASKAYGRAWEETLRWSFQSKSGVLVKALSFIRNQPGPIGFVTKFILPFLNTPANVMKTGMRKSPFGIVPVAYEAARGRYKGSPEAKALLVRRASEQMIAYAILALLIDMVKPDDEDEFKRPLITGSKKTFVTQGQRESETRNYPPTSIRIGNKWFNYGRLEPFATMMATTVDILNAWGQHKKGFDSDATGTLVNSLSANFRDKAFLTTIGDIIDAFQEGGAQKGAMIVQRVVSGFSPNIARTVMRSFDPYIRDMRNSEKGGSWLVKTGVRTLQMAVPLPQFQPEPRKDIYGRNVEKAGGVLYNILSPFRMQDGDKIKKVDAMLRKWNDSREVAEGWYPSTPNNPKIKILGTKNEIKLTPEEFSEYQKIAGESAAKRLATMYFNYDKPTEKDIDRIRDVFTESRDMARSRIRPKVIARAFKERGKNG